MLHKLTRDGCSLTFETTRGEQLLYLGRLIRAVDGDADVAEIADVYLPEEDRGVGVFSRWFNKFKESRDDVVICLTPGKSAIALSRGEVASEEDIIKLASLYTKAGFTQLPIEIDPYAEGCENSMVYLNTAGEKLLASISNV